MMPAILAESQDRNNARRPQHNGLRVSIEYEVRNAEALSAVDMTTFS